MVIKTEQDIPLSHAATLQTKIKDLSSHNQHKHFEVLRSSTYILILVIHDISVYKRVDCLSSFPNYTYIVQGSPYKSTKYETIPKSQC